MATIAETPRKSTSPAATARQKTGPKPKPIDYSRFKLAFRNPGDFARYLDGYPDTSAILGYFYRLKPKIDFGLIGRTDSFIHKSANPAEMNLDYCANRWGRGLYLIKLTDANRAVGEQEVARAWFDVADPDLLPVYDPRTLLVNDPENADEVARLIATGVLVRDGDHALPRVRSESAGPVVSIAPAAAAPAPAPVVFGDSLGQQIILKLLERSLPSVTPPTPSDVLEQSFRIADRLQPPPQTAAALPTLDQIADAVALRMKAGVPAAAPFSEFEVWERVNALLEKVGAGRDVAAASGPWSLLAPIIDSFLRPLTPLLTAYLGSKVAAVPAPAASIAPATPAARTSFLPATAPIMDRVIEVATLALQKFGEGIPGFRFASWVVGFYPGGAEVYDFLEKAGGTAGCMGMIAMVPALQSQIGGDAARTAAIEAWLDDFFTYDLAGGSTSAGVAGVEAAA